MKKNGFTLVELTVIILLIGIIIVITAPVFIGVVNNSSEALEKEQKIALENAAREWGLKYVSLKEKDGKEVASPCNVSISTLINAKEGVLEKKTFSNVSVGDFDNAGFCITYESNQFNYVFSKNLKSDCPKD